VSITKQRAIDYVEREWGTYWSDDDLFEHYESLRLALIDLVERLPEDAFRNKDIEGWLADDVVRHYEEHPIPG
jgi:hypothetical protein